MKTLERLAWPRHFPREFKTCADLKTRPAPHRLVDRLALEHARQLRREQEALSGLTQTYSESFFVGQNFSTINTFTSELSLLGGNLQPAIPPFTFDRGGQGGGKSITLIARGVLSTTSTPTLIFQWRLGTTIGSTFLSGTSVGVSATITTASGVTNQWWESRLDLICTTPGMGAGNCTLQGSGYVTSPGGFASPYIYPLEPTTPATATWTAVIDDSVTQFVNFSVTCGSSSSSNALTCKFLKAYCEN